MSASNVERTAILETKIEALETQVVGIETMVQAHDTYITEHRAERRTVSWLASSIGGVTTAATLFLLLKLWEAAFGR